MSGPRPPDKDGVDDLVYHTRTEIDEGQQVDGFNYWRGLNSIQMYLVDGETQISWHWTDGDSDTPYDERGSHIARYRIDGPGAYTIIDDIRLRTQAAHVRVLRCRTRKPADSHASIARATSTTATDSPTPRDTSSCLTRMATVRSKQIEIPGTTDIQPMYDEPTLSIRGSNISFVARDRDSGGLKVLVARIPPP